jgi:hypothetical protein
MTTMPIEQAAGANRRWRFSFHARAAGSRRDEPAVAQLSTLGVASMRQSRVPAAKVMIIIMVLSLAVVGIVSLYALWPHQPTHQGQPLSWWLERRLTAHENRHENRVPLDEERAAEAIRQMGTNSLPTLLRMLRARDSRLKQVAMAWSAKQSVIKFPCTPADRCREQALEGYRALGPVASGQILALSEVLTNDPLPAVRDMAARALEFIARNDGDRAAPALLKAAKDKDKEVRNSSFWALGRVHPSPEATIPVLIGGLDDSYQTARENAASALGFDYGPQAKAAVPALLRTLTTNVAASHALSQIDPEAAAKAGVK